MKSSFPKIKEGDFKKVALAAIREKRHVEYVKKVLVDFEKYRQFFETTVFITDNPKNNLYSFRVTYLEMSPFWRKPAWRDFEILGTKTLELFAKAIVDSMGWWNDHLHAFTFPDPAQKTSQYAISPYVVYTWCPEDYDDPFPTYKTKQIKIYQLNFNRFPKIRFEFDFGDGHTFDVEYKGNRRKPKNEGKREFPWVVKEKGVPPEQYPPCE